jgi:putative ABC transport system permease protein
VGRRFEKKLDREMRFHVDAAAAEYIARGVPAEEARRRALADFGAVELAKDEMRDLHPHRWLEQLARDLRYAFRQLRHAPTFAGTVILTLAVAIGANTAIFSVVRAVMMQPLPYRDPSRLVCVWHSDRADYTWYTFSHPRFQYFAQHVGDLAQLAAYDDESATVLLNGEPVRVEGGRVSANFFSLLGVTPALGRSFTPDEDRHGAHPVAVLSDRFWRERLGADPHIVGRAIPVDGEQFTVIGVMPAGFQFLGVPVDVWRSRIVDTRTFAPASVEAGASYLTVVARLGPGVSPAQFAAKLKVLSEQYRIANPGNSDLLLPVHADLLQTKVYAAVHVTLLVLWGAVACLLIIACANVANLVLARGIARNREIQVRMALGASRVRIAQQLVLENLFLSLTSILLSLPLSVWGMRELVSALRRNSPAVPDVRADANVMMFLFGIAAAIGILMGLMPLFAVHCGEFRGSERGSSFSKWSAQLRNGIGAAQIAFCVVLLAAAGLLMESFLRMSTMRTGVRTEQVAIFPLDLMPDRYDSPVRRVNFYQEAIERAASIPGVSEAAVASRVDLVGSGLRYLVQPEGRGDVGAQNPIAWGRSVSPNYFQILGIPLLSGRRFDDHDTALSERVAIVNEAFARKYFPDASPIGKHITYSTDRITCEIVGVVADVRAALGSTGPDDQIYLPVTQRPWLVATLLVRTSNPSGIGNAIREQVRAIDPEQAVAESITFDQLIARRLGRPRTETTVVAVFALTALFLAAVGVYGVIAYSVAQRQKEIGIRIALGAHSSAVRALVFRQTLEILAVGFAAGLPIAFALSRLYSSLLFAVTAGDPIAFGGACLLLLMVASAATYLPARRATRVDPISALRVD